jgi:hypothetical protein
MPDDVARWMPEDRQELFEQVAAERNLTAIVVEKDYWVCWMLGTLFSGPLRDAMVFKGGTSLSKVYGAIQRFSEDIDLCVNRAELGLSGAPTPEMLTSRKQRETHADEIQAACHRWVSTTLLPALKADVARALGTHAFSCDVDANEPGTIVFAYPVSIAGEGRTSNYLKPTVRLELGARGEGTPADWCEIRSICAEVRPDAAPRGTVRVLALAAERTFWEKAILTHAEYHRPVASKTPIRLARHYYDLVMLARRGVAETALQKPDLLKSVVVNTATFFERTWGSYDTAVPGSLRNVPPVGRQAELRSDYAAMAEMFFEPEPAFGDLLAELVELERTVNALKL